MIQTCKLKTLLISQDTIPKISFCNAQKIKVREIETISKGNKWKRKRKIYVIT